MSTLSSKVVVIDRDLAELFLSQEKAPEAGVSGTNRSHSPMLVREYAEQMLKGAWRLTHQGIAFHVDGRLIDGGHRMRAIIAAAQLQPDIKVPMMVTDGLTDEDVMAMDIGKRRKPGDFLAMEGEISATMLAGLIRMAHFYENGTWISSAAYRKYRLSPVEQQGYLDANPDLRQAVYEGSAVRKLVNQTSAGSLWFLSHKHRPTVDVDGFLKQLKEGTGPDWRRGNPVYTLRELMIRASKDHREWTAIEQLALLIQALVKFDKGQECRALTFRTDQDFPML